MSVEKPDRFSSETWAFIPKNLAACLSEVGRFFSRLCSTLEISVKVARSLRE